MCHNNTQTFCSTRTVSSLKLLSEILTVLHSGHSQLQNTIHTRVVTGTANNEVKTASYRLKLTRVHDPETITKPMLVRSIIIRWWWWWWWWWWW